MSQFKEGILYFKSEIKTNMILISLAIFSGSIVLIIDHLSNPPMPVLSSGLAIMCWTIFGLLIIVRNFVR